MRACNLTTGERRPAQQPFPEQGGVEVQGCGCATPECPFHVELVVGSVRQIPVCGVGGPRRAQQCEIEGAGERLVQDHDLVCDPRVRDVANYRVHAHHVHPHADVGVGDCHGADRLALLLVERNQAVEAPLLYAGGRGGTAAAAGSKAHAGVRVNSPRLARCRQPKATRVAKP